MQIVDEQEFYYNLEQCMDSLLKMGMSKKAVKRIVIERFLGLNFELVELMQSLGLLGKRERKK